MGKRSAVVELFLGDMGSMQRELRPSTQREDQLTMETKLETDSSESCEPTAEERGAGNPHATFCGSRGRATASGDPVGEEKSSSRIEGRGHGSLSVHPEDQASDIWSRSS